MPLEPEWTELRAESDGALTRAMQLWRRERDRVAHYGAEASLEQAFIQPMLEILGWGLWYQVRLEGRRPDYALFLDDESKTRAVRAGRGAPGFWDHPAILADAKAWDTNLDRPTRIGTRREYPPEQIEWYLLRSRRPFGILTNGRLWRLIPRELGPGKARFQTYLQVNLPDILSGPANGPQFVLAEEGALREDFFRFYLFFSPRGFQAIEGRAPLVDRALRGSSEYALAVGENLKQRVFEALRLCIEGFLKYGPNGLSATADIEQCREQSFVLLYRLLFIMYAEDRGLLPYRRSRPYTENRSLARHRDEIATKLDQIADRRETEYPADQIAIYEHSLSLFDLINRGDPRYGVAAYNGGLFDSERHAFLAEKRIADAYLARVVDQLGRAEDHAHAGQGLFRVDYRDLAIQHLGSIYEGLLELHPRFASDERIVIRERGVRKVERTISSRERTPQGWEPTGTGYPRGSVYLETEKGERRSSGSYYTPDHIVGYIVQGTLGPLCERVTRDLEKEIGETREKRAHARGASRRALDEQLDGLRQDFDDRVLRLRILDPAMGSGHFLVRACQYLAEEIATNPYSGDPQTDRLNGDESTLTFWKRRVVESCIFGVDINPMAVELAKLALWLETVYSDSPLSFLDHHLRCGNSLVGGRISELGTLPDAPPLIQNAFKQQVEQRLPILLEPLKRIRTLPSQTPDDIKEKDRLYRRTFQPVCETFRAVADLWCSSFFAAESAAVTPDRYKEALGTMPTTPAFKKMTAEPWFSQAVQPVRSAAAKAFHWELEFPEVFFDLSGRRAEAGFDAIVGNPPYDVLSEKETGHDLSRLKVFVAHESIYGPSRRGKNNLYKLFICRALDLLADGGRLGFIVPMPLLGDDQAADLRRALLDSGVFTSIDAFPQKDDPTRRVFLEAKLSTAVFTMLKSGSATVRAQPFVVRQHRANTIDEDSPSLQLRCDDIPLYDPANRAIVACSQTDWDLAVRIMRTGRVTRLGEFCQFFQGEVNETIQRRKGSLLQQGGKLVTRGACVCLYAVREASQGNDIHLDVGRFLRDACEGTKAYHHQCPRMVLQESSPQNNFRRLIAAPLPAGELCNHTINYCPEQAAQIPLDLMLAILNSKLADWYFRLGSTNAHVSHYQIQSLPCPLFTGAAARSDRRLRERVFAALDSSDLDRAYEQLEPALAQAPFPLVARDVLVELVRRIIAIEQARGEIARTERSALAPAAQPLQDLIDRILYAMAGLTPDESAGLEARLAHML